jgi:hypothetical protein
LAAGFDPTFSYRLVLDHGFCLPLWRIKPNPLPAVLPIVVNCIEHPMPTIRRSMAFGRMLAAALRSHSGRQRIAILASGGLSHSIGEPTMGVIEEASDRMCIDMFRRAPDDTLEAALEGWLATAGNGGHEVRTWVVAHAAAGGRGFDLIGYRPTPEVYVGCGFAEWRIAV